MKLSILIPLTPERFDNVKNLLNILVEKEDEGIVTTYKRVNDWVAVFKSSKYKSVEVVLFCDEKELTLGEKREKLYQLASGEYSWQIDSDDLIAPDAIEKILAAMENKPDCITFRENCMMNGVYKSSNHSLKYERWQDNHDAYDYVRTPFYKDVIKTEIARSVPFPHIRYNEDEQWAAALRPHLKTEIHLEEEIYFYIYNSSPNETNRYGFHKD
jgi:glycosyltransferase involved in cell wall biosynthesis